MVNLLIERLSSLALPERMPAELVKCIADNAEICHFLKGDYLLKNGQQCIGAHFLALGVARSWYEDGEHQVTTRLMDEGFIITNWKSYYSQQPSEENITTLEKSVTVFLPRALIYELYTRFPVFNTVGRRQVEYSFCQADDRTNMLRQHAPERYQWFCSRHPNLLPRVQLKYIASYLGMEISTLSRVRSGLKKNPKTGSKNTDRCKQ